MWEVNLRVILGPKFSKTGPKTSKTGTKFSKTGPKTSKTEAKTQSNGRVNLIYSRIHPWDLIHGCVLLPLGSPRGVPKRPYVHVPVVPRPSVWCMHELGSSVRVPGWV